MKLVMLAGAVISPASAFVAGVVAMAQDPEAAVESAYEYARRYVDALPPEAIGDQAPAIVWVIVLGLLANTFLWNPLTLRGGNILLDLADRAVNRGETPNRPPPKQQRPET